MAKVKKERQSAVRVIACVQQGCRAVQRWRCAAQRLLDAAGKKEKDCQGQQGCLGQHKTTEVARLFGALLPLSRPCEGQESTESDAGGISPEKRMLRASGEVPGALPSVAEESRAQSTDRC